MILASFPWDCRWHRGGAQPFLVFFPPFHSSSSYSFSLLCVAQWAARPPLRTGRAIFICFVSSAVFLWTLEHRQPDFSHSRTHTPLSISSIQTHTMMSGKFHVQNHINSICSTRTIAFLSIPLDLIPSSFRLGFNWNRYRSLPIDCWKKTHRNLVLALSLSPSLSLTCNNVGDRHWRSSTLSLPRLPVWHHDTASHVWGHHSRFRLWSSPFSDSQWRAGGVDVSE